MNLFSAIAQGGIIGMGDYLGSLFLVRHQLFTDVDEDPMPALNLLMRSLNGQKAETDDMCLVVESEVSYVHYKHGFDVFGPYKRRDVFCPMAGRINNVDEEFDFVRKAIFNRMLREQNSLMDFKIDIKTIKKELYYKASRHPETDNTSTVN